MNESKKRKWVYKYGWSKCLNTTNSLKIITLRFSCQNKSVYIFAYLFSINISFFLMVFHNIVYFFNIWTHFEIEKKAIIKITVETNEYENVTNIFWCYVCNTIHTEIVIAFNWNSL